MAKVLLWIFHLFWLLPAFIFQLKCSFLGWIIFKTWWMTLTWWHCWRHQGHVPKPSQSWCPPWQPQRPPSCWAARRKWAAHPRPPPSPAPSLCHWMGPGLRTAGQYACLLLQAAACSWSLSQSQWAVDLKTKKHTHNKQNQKMTARKTEKEVIRWCCCTPPPSIILQFWKHSGLE